MLHAGLAGVSRYFDPANTPTYYLFEEADFEVNVLVMANARVVMCAWIVICVCVWMTEMYMLNITIYI